MPRHFCVVKRFVVVIFVHYIFCLMRPGSQFQARRCQYCKSAAGLVGHEGGGIM